MDRFDTLYGALGHEADGAGDDGLATGPRAPAPTGLIGLAAGDRPTPLPGHSAAEPQPASLGALLRSLRIEAELSLKQVADAVGVSKPTVWAWENSRARPTRDKWDAIARALGVTLPLMASAAKAERLNKAIGARIGDGDTDRAALLTAGRDMIARAYNVTPSAVRITVEVSL